MTIGDWEVTVLSTKIIPNQPGNPKAGNIKMVDYIFKHKSLDYQFLQHLGYLKPHTDEQVLEFLTFQTKVLEEVTNVTR